MATLAVVAVPEPSDKAMSYYYVTTALWVAGIAWALLELYAAIRNVRFMSIRVVRCAQRAVIPRRRGASIKSDPDR